MHPVLLRIEGAPISAYGVLAAAGYTAGILWLMKKIPEMRLTALQFWSLIYAVFLGVLIGGKLGFFIVEWREFEAEPWAMLANWRNGWVFWFGFAGGMLAAGIFFKIYNRLYRPRRWLPLADYFGAAIPLGHWIGRLGCFAQGCCHGRPTRMPWGVVFRDPASSVRPEFLGLALHPTQLYEAAGELGISLFLIFYVLPNIRRKRFSQGTAFLGYIILYSMFRFAIEFFRGDDRGVFLWQFLSPSQWACLAGLVMAGILLWRQGILARDAFIKAR